MINDTFWIVELTTEDGNDRYYFHTFEKAYQFAKEFAINDLQNENPEDFEGDCHTIEDLVDFLLQKYWSIDECVWIFRGVFKD